VLEDTHIERAILDQNIRIGHGVTIRSHEGKEDQDGEHHAIRDGIVVISKRAVIPDGTTI
jgi:glucose-1-phosphate adenylyltransferase